MPRFGSTKDSRTYSPCWPIGSSTTSPSRTWKHRENFRMYNRTAQLLKSCRWVPQAVISTSNIFGNLNTWNWSSFQMNLDGKIISTCFFCSLFWKHSSRNRIAFMVHLAAKLGLNQMTTGFPEDSLWDILGIWFESDHASHSNTSLSRFWSENVSVCKEPHSKGWEMRYSLKIEGQAFVHKVVVNTADNGNDLHSCILSIIWS